MAGGMMYAEDKPAADKPANPPRVTYPGPFRVELTRVGGVRDLRSGMHSASIGAELAWEPKLRPMLLKLESAGVTVTDDKGRKVVSRRFFPSLRFGTKTLCWMGGSDFWMTIRNTATRI